MVYTLPEAVFFRESPSGPSTTAGLTALEHSLFVASHYAWCYWKGWGRCWQAGKSCPAGQLQDAPSSSAMSHANQSGSLQPPHLTAVMDTRQHRSLNSSSSIPQDSIWFFPAFSPPWAQLIDSSSWSSCCLSPSDGRAAVISRERANELLLYFFSLSVSSKVMLRANGVSQLVWFIWFNVPPWPLGLAWPFIQALKGPKAT